MNYQKARALKPRCLLFAFEEFTENHHRYAINKNTAPNNSSASKPLSQKHRCDMSVRIFYAARQPLFTHTFRLDPIGYLRYDL